MSLMGTFMGAGPSTGTPCAPLMLAPGRGSGTPSRYCAGEVRGGVGAAAARAARSRLAAVSRMGLEGQPVQHQAHPPHRRAGVLADDALALQVHFQLAHLGGE